MNIILAKALIVLFFVVWVVSAVKTHNKRNGVFTTIFFAFIDSIIAVLIIALCIQLILFLFWG